MGRREEGRYERKKMEWESGRKGGERHLRRERGGDRRKGMRRFISLLN
jgi:hypothetical protein